MSNADSSRLAAAAPNATPVPRLGEFETTGILGRGGFSVVYSARDFSLRRTIAIKEYLPSAIAMRMPDGTVTLKSPEHHQAFKAGLESFLNEARLLAQFMHPALVHVYRVWEQNGTAYMAMQYCVGKTLNQISQSEPVKVKDEGWLKATFAPILDALELLHANNCFHRDIAPDNILILDNGGPVLLDFGAARQIVGGMTQALTVVLKPGFAPIEQYSDDASVQQGSWTDVYGVGAVLYYLLTGKPPLAAVARVVKDPMAKLADSNEFAGVSRSFRQAIDSALAVHSNQRIQTIAELRRALQLPTSPPLGRKVLDAPIQIQMREPDLKPMPPLERSIDRSVQEALQPSRSRLNEPADAALETTIAAVPTVPEEDTFASDADESLQATQMPAFDLKASEKIPDALPEEEPPPDSPDSVQPDEGAPTPVPPPPASIAWARVFSYLGQGSRIAAKTTADALKRNAARILKVVGQSPRLRNTVALGMAAVVGFGGALGLLHKPAPDVAGSSSSASSLVQPPADSPANTAMATPPGIGGQAATAQGEPPQASTAATPAVSAVSDLPKAYGGPPITAGPIPAPNPTSLVHLSIKPWGQIAVDGQSQGISPPLTSLSLPPGQHLILITHGDYSPVYVPVTVLEGKDLVVSYQFE